jgi:hypothetical protein
MSSDVVYSAIKAYLTANWTTTEIAWENENFQSPLSSDGSPTAWVAVEITGNLYSQASIGAGTASGNLWREEGLLWLHIFVPTGSGSLVARQYAKQLADLFRGLSLSGDTLRFRDASIGRGQPGSEDGLYWGLSVSIEWQHDS